MNTQMPDANQIQDNAKLDPEVAAAVKDDAGRAIHELKDALHEGCEVVVSIENYTTQCLAILKQSQSQNNGHFKEAPEPFILGTSIGLCSSEGGTGVGNKNYVLYGFAGMELLIYWHSARIGEKTYWIDFNDYEKYKNKDDKEILNIGKDNQSKGADSKEHGSFVITSTFGEECIKVSVLTKAQVG